MIVDNQISHEPELYLDLVVFNADGTQKYTYYGRSESFVYNWILAQYNASANLTTTTGIDTNGVARALNAEGRGFYCYDYPITTDTPPLGTTTWGIVAGTGSAPVAFSNYQLSGLLTHGTGSSQLVYKPMWFDGATASGSISYDYINRQVSNMSLAPITVTEVGLIISSTKQAVPAYHWLGVRDLLSTPITLGLQEALLIKYTYLVSV